MHRASWDGLSSRGKPVASGIYVIRAQIGGAVASRKVVVAR